MQSQASRVVSLKEHPLYWRSLARESWEPRAQSKNQNAIKEAWRRAD